MFVPRLAEVGDDVVDVDRNSLPHLFVRCVRQAVLDVLQAPRSRLASVAALGVALQELNPNDALAPNSSSLVAVS